MGRSREDEHRAFIEWLITTISDEQIDTVIVAGDIFDIGSPPNYALKLYYDFLISAKEAGAKRIIIIGGNHDSISTLKAPKEILERLNITVIAGSEDEDSLIVYDDAIICAVPFLRESIIRKSIQGLSSLDRDRLTSEGIKRFYTDIANRAMEIRGDRDIPIVATGHLTTLNAQIGDSERDIYIGSLLEIGGDFLDRLFDYTALGHIHRYQRVSDRVYYSGSPIPLSFKEAQYKKYINIVSFDAKEADIKRVQIPTFRELIRLKGSAEDIIKELKTLSSSVWIEVTIDEEDTYLWINKIRDVAKELDLNILAIKVEKDIKVLSSEELKDTTLESFSPKDIFEIRLKQNSLDETQKQKLKQLFSEILLEVEHENS